jgi:hypothetical protein
MTGMPSAVTRREFLQGGIAAGIAFRLNVVGPDAHAIALASPASGSPDSFDATGRLDTAPMP